MLRLQFSSNCCHYLLIEIDDKSRAGDVIYELFDK
jgi:hypothetical protein